ncbi:MAG: type II secretion system F family protein, partial [Anaerolineales bacterium]
ALGFGIILAGIVALVGVANALSTGDQLGERLETYATLQPGVSRGRSNRNRVHINRLRLRMNSMLSPAMAEKINTRLMSANWPITETEFILIRIISAITGVVLGWAAFQSIISGVGFAVIAYLLPEIMLRRSIQSRQRKFEKQLIDVLVLVKGAVRSGYSFLQALDVVVQEMDAPASEEFTRVRREVGLGLPLSQALMNLHTRMQNDDMYLVITAVNINSQVGGNLSTMLEAVTNTIRDRVRLFSEVRALTSQQRFSGYLLSLMPFIMAAVLFIINPEYISRLFEPGIFLCIPIGALVFVILGNIVIRILSRIDV